MISTSQSNIAREVSCDRLYLAEYQRGYESSVRYDYFETGCFFVALRKISSDKKCCWKLFQSSSSLLAEALLFAALVS